MKRFILAAGALLMLSAVLAGCGERARSDQVATRGHVQPAWDAAANPFVVSGWKSGDQASWQQQMTKRAQNQNEFLRVN